MTKDGSCEVVRGNVRKPLKITVLRRLTTEETLGEMPEGVVADADHICQKFREGQTFTVDQTGAKPADFPCEWAWMDLSAVILGMQLGAHFIRFRDGLQYVCCTDGLRPVIFKLERQDE